MVGILEAVARQIGTTVDTKWEALLYITFRSRAEQLACYLSEYATDVFNVVCQLPT